MTEVTLDGADFKAVCKILYEDAALAIGEEKRYLVESRLSVVASTNKFKSIHELVRASVADASGKYRRFIVEAMVTHETSFFRDKAPFEALKESIFPELIEDNEATRTLSIWSAACSSGQEPYSIAMLMLDEFPQLSKWKIDILGTDVSNAVLADAKAAEFSELDVKRGLPERLRNKFFSQQGSLWRPRQEILSMVRFKQLNLAAPWPAMPKMDLVLLRNVLIYFDTNTKKEILERISRVLSPTGYLFLGSAETTSSLAGAYDRADVASVTCFQLRAA